MLKSSSITPLYKQVENILTERVRSGVYSPEQRLPSEAEIAAQFGVSTITVKKAIANMVERGMLWRKQGKGTFVVSPKHNRDMRRVISFTQVCRLNGTRPGSKTLEQKVIKAPFFFLSNMESTDNQVILISRLRYVNDVPMALETNWFPLSFSFLLEEDLENRSLFEVIHNNLDMTLVSARRTIEICYASAKEAKLLDVKNEAPLLKVVSTMYDQTDTPLFMGQQIINADQFKLIV